MVVSLWAGSWSITKTKNITSISFSHPSFPVFIDRHWYHSCNKISQASSSIFDYFKWSKTYRCPVMLQTVLGCLNTSIYTCTGYSWQYQDEVKPTYKGKISKLRLAITSKVSPTQYYGFSSTYSATYLKLRQTLLGSKVETGRKHVTLVHVHVEVVPSK